MIDNSIEYKSIIMRCDRIDYSAYLNLDVNLEVAFYLNGMEDIWVDIQKRAGEFLDESVLSAKEYFLGRFGFEQEQLRKRCLFLKKKETNDYVGTCMAWFAPKEEGVVPVLHWLAVDDMYTGKGYARMLITEVLKVFEQLGEGKKIYLHTQPCSYKAIKLYNDFGFCITQKDTYATAINECQDALSILEKYMSKDSFNKLRNTQVM